MKEIIEELKKNISAKEAEQFTVDLCSQNTVNPPGNEYLVKDIVEKKFKEMGFGVKAYEKAKGRPNIVGVYGSGSPSVAIIGHMDTVGVDGQTWKTDPFKPVVKEGKIYARGAQDSKGSAVSGFLGAKAFLKVMPKFKGTLYVLATADEEHGDTYGMDYLIERGMKFDYVLVPDAGHMNTAIYGEKGVIAVRMISRGKAFHGSEPSKGFNAIWPLTQLFEKLYKFDWESLPYDKKGFRDGTVLNIGKIKGGSAENAVPDYAEMSLMWRYPVGVKSKQIFDILDQMIKEVEEEEPRAKLDFSEDEIVSIPFVGNLDSKIAKSFKEASEELGFKMKFKTMGGQTTAKSLYHNGSEVIMHYPQSDDVDISHMPDEYIEIKNMEKSALLYALTLYKLFSAK